VRICGRCGVYAPPVAYSCEHCGADLAEHARSVEWGRYIAVAIELQFTCRGCGLLSPLDWLDADGAVECVRCDLVQKFEDGWWRRVLDRAHAVGDLWGADPEGRRRSRYAIDEVNPFAERAQRHSGAVFAEEIGAIRGAVPSNLRVWLAPGQPLSPVTVEPMEITASAAGRIETSAGGDDARYVTSRRAMELHRGLVGAIADDQRMDRAEAEAELEREGRAHTFRCTGCGASLPLDGALRLVRCSYCSSVSWIPSRVRHAAQSEPLPDTWWLVFEGSSPYRRFLEWHPATWKQAHPPERLIEDPPTVQRPAMGRLVALGWWLCVPAVFVLVAGLLIRAPWWLGWLAR
jgi:DNA-directed RNA polymerase subunit RPC12/RpoP